MTEPLTHLQWGREDSGNRGPVWNWQPESTPEQEQTEAAPSSMHSRDA
jgi:hypothetical protein